MSYTSVLIQMGFPDSTVKEFRGMELLMNAKQIQDFDGGAHIQIKRTISIEVVNNNEIDLQYKFKVRFIPFINDVVVAILAKNAAPKTIGYHFSAPVRQQRHLVDGTKYTSEAIPVLGLPVNCIYWQSTDGGKTFLNWEFEADLSIG